MTLNEKFEDALDVWNGVDICEKIADEFAIDFADWFFEPCYEDQVGYYEAADLLNFYKKEKGL